MVVLISQWIQIRSYRTSAGSALTLTCLEISELRYALCHWLPALDNSFLMITCNVVSITCDPNCIITLSPNLLLGSNNIRTSQMYALMSGFCRLTFLSYGTSIPPVSSLSSNPSKLWFFNPYDLVNDLVIADS